MNRFLKYSLLFLVPLCVVLVLGEAVVRQYPTSYGLKAHQADARRDAWHTLVFGNSRTYYGILTDSLDAALNLANVSQTLEYDWRMLHAHFPDGGAGLRQLVVQLDYSNVFDVPLSQSRYDANRCTYYRLYAAAGGGSPLAMELFAPSRFLSKLEPALRYIASGECQMDCDSTGWGITTTRRFDAGRMGHATESGLERYRAIDLEQMPYNAAYVRQIGEYCRAHHLRMILVAMPIWRELYQLKGHDEEPLLEQLVGECVKNYGAEFRDYTADPRMRDEDFVDAVHLSPAGAQHFTQMIKDDFGLQ